MTEPAAVRLHRGYYGPCSLSCVCPAADTCAGTRQTKQGPATATSAASLGKQACLHTPMVLQRLSFKKRRVEILDRLASRGPRSASAAAFHRPPSNCHGAYAGEGHP